MEHTIGFFINPIAGMGGRVGLKGTDGMEKKARELGAKEVAQSRGKIALYSLLKLAILEKDFQLKILTSGGKMGEQVCNKILYDLGKNNSGNITISIIHNPDSSDLSKLKNTDSPAAKSWTTAEDSLQFCRTAKKNGAKLMLFTGGDGTARDVVRALGGKAPILGIPSGVKMHSGVFARNPKNVGEIVMEFLTGRAKVEEREVMDLDENAYRKGDVRTKLFSLAKVPVNTQVQGCKNVVTGSDDDADRKSIAVGLQEIMAEQDGLYIMGAGSTIRDIGKHLGLNLTPLGFDMVKLTNGKPSVIRQDVNESEILAVEKENTGLHLHLVITPIGAQGFVLGRGTQVISKNVLKKIAKENIIIVATKGKLAITPMLHVDAGEQGKKLTGFRKIMLGYRRFALKKVQ